MRTIWKFPLPWEGRDRFTVEAPAGATPLRVDFDPQGDLCLWAEVDSEAIQEPLTVIVVGTGHAIPDDAGKYVGTFVTEPFVFHAFEVRHG